MEGRKTKHRDMRVPTPESLELMCLSILHFLLHLFILIRDLGYRSTTKTWKKRNMDWVEIDRRTAEVNVAFEGKGLTLGYLKDGKIQGGLCIFTYLSI